MGLLRNDRVFRCCCFSNKIPERLRDVVHEALCDWPLAVDKAPQGPLIDAQASRRCDDTSKHLNTMSEVVFLIVH